MMRYKLLGASGLRVSELCLGAMTFGEAWGTGASKAESRAMFDAYAEAGGNFIDTANFYTKGESETFIGEFIQGERERWVIATKYSLDTSGCGEVNASGNHRKNMMQAVEASLRQCLGSGRVVVSDAALAQVSAALRNGSDALAALEEMGVHFSPVESKSALRAGEMLRRHRQRGDGARPLVDFLVGAHALLQCDGLVTFDTAFHRDYFKGLKLIQPKA